MERWISGQAKTPYLQQKHKHWLSTYPPQNILKYKNATAILAVAICLVILQIKKLSSLLNGEYK